MIWNISEKKRALMRGPISFKEMPHKINYGIMYTIHSPNKTNTIKYETAIQCLKIFPNNTTQFLITRISKIYINDVEPELIADVLATQVAEILYPLLLQINAKGKILSILNFQDIIKRWSEKKQEINKNYQGDIIEKYLKLTELSLQDESTLLRCISTDWFLCTYFNEIYQSHSSTIKIERWINFPLIGKAKPVVFRGTQNMEEYYTEDNLISVKVDGELADDRCIADLENELNYPHFGLNNSMSKATGKYRGQYYLDPIYHSIDMAYVECEISLAEKKKITVLINSLNTPKYKLPNESNFSFAVEEAHEKRKKSFW